MRLGWLIAGGLIVAGINGADADDLEHYACHRTLGPITIDGKLDEPSWQKTPWSRPLVSILTGDPPPPQYETRVALLWDDTYLYLAFMVPERDVWATLKERDSLVWMDNDIEVFIAGQDAYYELEVNALGTIYEVFWIWQDVFKPGSVWDVPEWNLETQKVRTWSGLGGHVHPRGTRWGFLEWDFPGLLHAVHVEGTLNKRDDVDTGWTVELAFPWKGMKWLADGRALPPESGDVWRIDCSRFEHVPPELAMRSDYAGWTWNKHGYWDAHIPETFAYVHFSGEPVGEKSQ